MALLTNTGRTILRSRVRRHLHAPTTDVAAMSVADLVQAAALLGLDTPTATDDARYEAGKADGLKGTALMARVDAAARADGRGGPGMAAVAAVERHAGQSATTQEVEAGDEAEAAAEAEAEAEAAADEAEAEAEAAADETETAAAAAVAHIHAAFGAGDFAGYQAQLIALARRAVAPPPAPRIEYLPAPSAGAATAPLQPIPHCLGARTAETAGVAIDDVTGGRAPVLDAYDAPDAPAVNPHYVWPRMTGAALSALNRGRNIFLTGPAGTGKTEFAKQLAARWGRPFVRISCDDQTEAATLTGVTVPDAAGGVRWQDGQLTRAIRRPGTVILIDEPSVARPGALFVLQALLDADRRMHVAETGEVIPAAPGVVFVLADNTAGTGDESGQYEGTRRLNRAFLDRAAITMRLDYLTPEREARALSAVTGCSARVAASLAMFAAVTRTAADKGTLSHGLGMRRLIALAELISDGVSAGAAFALAVIETAPFDDREPLRQLWVASGAEAGK